MEFTEESTSFGIHEIAISRNQLEIKYSNICRVEMAQRSQWKSLVTNCLHILIPEYNQSNTPLVSDIKIRIAI